MDKLYDIGLNYFSNINLDPNKLDILYVEKNILFEYGGYKFRGIIDLMYKDENGDLIILDHKTSEYPLTKQGRIKKNKQPMMDGYTKQLAMYAYGVKNIIGIMPKYIGWNFIRESKTYLIPVTDEIISNTMNWATGVIKKIYNTYDFAKNGEYFMCKNLCDFRDICN